MNKIGCLLFCFWVAVIAAEPDFSAAPQEFRQEIARHRDATNGLGSGAVKLLMSVNGQARLLVGDQWFSRASEGWTRVSGPKGRADGGEIIQIAPVGKTNFVATSHEIFSVVDLVSTSL